MDDTDSDLNRSLLIFLVALYEQRHLGRTATRLSISLPKASRQLAAARRIFGDPLYVRFGQGLAPTARAHEVTAQARSVLEEMRRLFEDRTFRPEEMTRVVRVLCLDNAIPIVIEPLVDALFAKAPKAGLALEPHSEETFLRLQAGDADMAVFPAVHLPEGFRSVTLLRTPYVHAVRAGHPLEALLEQGRLSPADLRRFRRIQICVHPDVDDTAEGVPGPARIPLRAAETMLWTESWPARRGSCIARTPCSRFRGELRSGFPKSAPSRFFHAHKAFRGLSPRSSGTVIPKPTLRSNGFEASSSRPSAAEWPSSKLTKCGREGSAAEHLRTSPLRRAATIVAASPAHSRPATLQRISS